MDIGDDSSRYESFPASTSRNMSISSSAFLSANQSPFFSPRSPTGLLSESIRSDAYFDSIHLNPDPIGSGSGIPDISLEPGACTSSDFIKFDHVSSTTTGVSTRVLSSFDNDLNNSYNGYNGYNGSRWKHQDHDFSSTRMRCCDVFIGLHGNKSSLLRFANWLRAEFEVSGMSCFVSDRARCRNSRKRVVVERAMDVSSFGVVIVTRKSFKNPFTIEELRFFASKKNLVPIFFDLGPADCLVRDIVEKRGELWEKHGGELWVLYGGVENEWREAVHGLSRVDEWKLEARDGNLRECVLKAVELLAMKLGRRSVVERLSKWREKVEKDEFPYPRNENFIGRKKELSDLEFVLFGDVYGESERDFIELKGRTKRKKSLTIGSMEERRREREKNRQRDISSRKGKEKVTWKESEKEIEMRSNELPHRNHHQKSGGGRHTRRKRSKIMYGKGIACVTGVSGIGKTELLLEYAYRNHQRYKMVLWIGGENRYIRQNYLNLWSFLEVDVGLEHCSEKTRLLTKSFEEQEDAAIFRVRKELMRNIPYLVVIDNLENEYDWWDRKLVMDLLPRFGGETHIIISTMLPRVMNLEPMKLSYLSGVDAMSLMQQGSVAKEYPIAELDALRVIEERVGRLTLGLAIVGAIFSELPINPSRLLDTINRMPLRDVSTTKRNPFLLQIFEVCFSIFDHAEGPRSLATRMVEVSGWFAPSAIPVSLLAVAARNVPEKRKRTKLWRKLLHSLSCGFDSSYTRKSEAEAASMLLRFNIAKSSTKQGYIHMNNVVNLYARNRGVVRGAANAMVQAIASRPSISISQHPEHIWAACFLVFRFGNGNDPTAVELKVSELLHFVKDVVLPLAIRTFVTFSRCGAALELLRLCTDAFEAADQTLVTPVGNWLDSSVCWRPVQTNAQLNPLLWQELALSRATLLETRAKLMLRGGQFDIGDDLIRKAIFIRTSICGEDHSETVSARETLSKITRLLANCQIHS